VIDSLMLLLRHQPGGRKNLEFFLQRTLKFLMSCPITSQKGGKAPKKISKNIFNQP